MEGISISALVGVCANVATAVGVLLLVWQVRLSGAAVRAQTRAAELQIYADLNLEFLDIISHFGERINDEGASLNDLTEQERRAIDRWFYLANMEYVVYNKKLLDDALLTQWADGIASATRKPIFLERWRTTASNFRVDPGFKKIFDQAAERSPGSHAS